MQFIYRGSHVAVTNKKIENSKSFHSQFWLVNTDKPMGKFFVVWNRKIRNSPPELFPHDKNRVIL